MKKIKIGDKIELKNIPNKKTETIKETFFDIVEILKSKKINEKDKLTWCSTMLSILETYFKEDEMESVVNAKKYLIPVLHNLVEKAKLENMPSFFEFYKKTYCFCARRDFECFIDYFEWNMPRKVYSNRRKVLLPYVNALNKLAFDPRLEYVIASYPPSIGKSYIATLWTAWAYGLSIDNSVLRLSYSEELVLGVSRTVKGYLMSAEFAEIFPLFKLYNGKPFEVEKESDWKIRNANVPKSNHIARTRNGATTGERAKFAIIFDDMTKGAEEAYSEKTHRDIYDKWLTEWWNRRDGLSCKFLFIGTQWCPEDILNRIIEDRNKVSRLLPTENPYVMESENHSTIVIRVPMLDNEGKTTCPVVYPQNIAEQIKDTTDPFLFSCVYQQDPIAPTGREFAWECIRTYVEMPNNLTLNAMATLDTARKGKDNVAMPIFRNDNNGNHYLIDAIYKQKAMDDLYDEIINKIIENRITTLVIENNIDTSLKPLLESKLNVRNVFWCTIIEKFNTVKKEERIKNNRGIIQKQVVFPDKSIIKPNTDIGRMMENITKYSFDRPNIHDDGIDSVCMYGSEIILGRGMIAKPKPITRPF